MTSLSFHPPTHAGKPTNTRQNTQHLDATRVRDLTELTIKSAIYVGAWYVHACMNYSVDRELI